MILYILAFCLLIYSLPDACILNMCSPFLLQYVSFATLRRKKKVFGGRSRYNDVKIWMLLRAPDKVRISISKMPISSPNPMFYHLLESSRWDDSSATDKLRFIVLTNWFQEKRIELKFLSFKNYYKKTENELRSEIPSFSVGLFSYIWLRNNIREE